MTDTEPERPRLAWPCVGGVVWGGVIGLRLAGPLHRLFLGLAGGKGSPFDGMFLGMMVGGLLGLVCASWKRGA